MARYFIDSDAHGDFAVWRDNGDDFPSALLYEYDVDDCGLWTLIAAAVND